MDDAVMMCWDDEVLAPYVTTAPESVHPLLFLDSYRCHMMESVVSCIQDLGVEVKHIPGGCTGKCQPVDVGIGKPLKNRIKNSWEDWMMEEGIDQAVTKPVDRAVLAQWCIDTIKDLGPTIVRNLWRHGEFSYFVEEDNDEASVVAV